MTIEFDGTNYCGWQSQPNGATVQDEIEKRINTITTEDIRIHSSGRTDAGVHAEHMVAIFHTEREIDTEKFKLSMNALLPDDIVLLKVESVDMSFHSRKSAKRKVYEYHILNRQERSVFLNRYAWHVRKPLDVDRMIAASKLLLGEHDFAAFASVGGSVKTTVRTIHEINIVRGGDMIVITCTGSGFLKQMVRNIVGLLVQVGQGKFDVGFVTEVLKKMSKEKLYVTAPACGLFLKNVIY